MFVYENVHEITRVRQNCAEPYLTSLANRSVFVTASLCVSTRTLFLTVRTSCLSNYGTAVVVCCRGKLQQRERVGLPSPSRGNQDVLVSKRVAAVVIRGGQLSVHPPIGLRRARLGAACVCAPAVCPGCCWSLFDWISGTWFSFIVACLRIFSSSK